MLPTGTPQDPPAGGASHVAVSEQWPGARSWAPETTAVSDAWVQAGCLGRPSRPWPRGHPQPPQRLLTVDGHASASRAPHDRVARASPDDVASATAARHTM